MKVSMWVQKKSVLIWATSLIVLLSFMTGCQRRLPTRPPSRDLTLIGTVNGVLGSQDAVYQQDIYNDVVTKEIVSIFQFADLKGKVVGKAQLTAASDLVALISSTVFNIPGETFVDVNGLFTAKVTISSPKARPDYYQVDVFVMETLDKVTFFIPKKPKLAKIAVNEETFDCEESNATVPLLSASLSGTFVFLCLGSQEVLIQAVTCLLNAPPFCGKSGVKEVYLQGSFSWSHGCEMSCRVTCKDHKQGYIGR